MMMPVVAEDGDQSRGESRISIYGNLPDSPQNMSLMQGDESIDPANDRSTRNLLPPNSGNGPLRGSFETNNSMPDSEESSSSLLQAVQNAGDDSRGEAPPYFEVVDFNRTGGPRQEMGSSGVQRAPEASSDAPRSATVGSLPSPDAQTRDNRNSRRLSGFRDFLHTFTNATPRTFVPAIPRESSERNSAHTRADSSMSITSSVTHESRIPPARERVTSRASHRPSNSGSGTALQSVFRTISRQRSHNTLISNHLDSPSMISLNSISAPLTHTLTRTEVSFHLSENLSLVLIIHADKLSSIWTYS